MHIFLSFSFCFLQLRHTSISIVTISIQNNSWVQLNFVQIIHINLLRYWCHRCYRCFSTSYFWYTFIRIELILIRLIRKVINLLVSEIWYRDLFLENMIIFYRREQQITHGNLFTLIKNILLRYHFRSLTKIRHLRLWTPNRLLLMLGLFSIRLSRNLLKIIFVSSFFLFNWLIGYFNVVVPIIWERVF